MLLAPLLPLVLALKVSLAIALVAFKEWPLVVGRVVAESLSPLGLVAETYSAGFLLAPGLLQLLYLA